MSKTHIDRDEASKILKVSTRTVDRYLRKYKFKTRKDGRRVLIRRTDVDKIIQDQIGHYVESNVAQTTATPESTTAIANVKVKDIKVEEVKKKDSTEKTEEKVYKELYGELKKENKEKQERLEAATYRVGQLETQIKNTVPLLDFTRKEKELKEAQIVLEQKAVESNLVIGKMEKKLKAERIAKWMYISLVGLLLVAEPILFLFWAFS